MEILGLLFAVGGFGVVFVMMMNLRVGMDGRIVRWMIGGVVCGVVCGVVGLLIASVSG